MFFFNGKRIARLVADLKADGFDVYEHMHQGMEHGIVIGLKGLDAKRLKPDALGIFIPTWELNSNTNLVLQRRFHEICESRPAGWTPFHKSQLHLG